MPESSHFRVGIVEDEISHDKPSETHPEKQQSRGNWTANHYYIVLGLGPCLYTDKKSPWSGLSLEMYVLVN